MFLLSASFNGHSFNFFSLIKHHILKSPPNTHKSKLVFLFLAESEIKKKRSMEVFYIYQLQKKWQNTTASTSEDSLFDLSNTSGTDWIHNIVSFLSKTWLMPYQIAMQERTMIQNKKKDPYQSNMSSFIEEYTCLH